MSSVQQQKYQHSSKCPMLFNWIYELTRMFSLSMLNDHLISIEFAENTFKRMTNKSFLLIIELFEHHLSYNDS